MRLPLAILLLAISASVTSAQDVAARRQNARDAARYDDAFRRYGKRFFGPAFDWRYFKAQGMAESGLDPTARSWVGARGVMQLMPTTFRQVASRQPELQSIDDPEWNIAAGIAHDRYLWKLWTKTVDEPDRKEFMFASYNAGEGTIARAHSAAGATARWRDIEQVAPQVPRWRYKETLGYVAKIRTFYEKLRR